MNRNKEMIQIQVGAFVAVGLFLVMMVVFMLGGEKRLFERHYTLVSYFNSISGLRTGAPIQLAGINVGSVGDILFEEDMATKKVKVILELSKKYKDRIRADSEASIITQGLLGDKMILVTVGTPTEAMLNNGEVLPTKPAHDLSSVIETGQDLLLKVSDVAIKLDDILKEITEGKGLAHSMIYDPEGGQIIDDLQIVSRNLRRTSYHFEQITGKINRGQGTVGALVNDATLFNDMKTLLGKANRNKLIRAVIRYTLSTKEEKLLKKE